MEPPSDGLAGFRRFLEFYKRPCDTEPLRRLRGSLPLLHPQPQPQLKSMPIAAATATSATTATAMATATAIATAPTTATASVYAPCMD